MSGSSGWSPSKAPHAQLLLVGYPQLVPPTGTCAELPFARGDYAYLAEFFVGVDAPIGSRPRRAEVPFLGMRGRQPGPRRLRGRGGVARRRATPTPQDSLPPLASEQRAVAALVADACWSSHPPG